MPYTPRWYQDEAVQSVFGYYAAGKSGNPVVAMPTASGKSLVIAEFIKFVLQRWPRQRIFLATHVKELIEQNAEKLREQWPNVPLGIFSAGLKQRDVNFPVIYAGIQSAIACIESFGWRDLMIIDEAHLVGHDEDTEYLDAIKRFRVINPLMKVIGLTATPYRLGHGMLSDGPIFTDVCYDLTEFSKFNRLIDEGFLMPLFPKRMNMTFDVSKVRVTGDDYNRKELQKAVDVDAVTYAACKETVEEGFDRKCWIVFASGIEHAEHVSSCLDSMGVTSTVIHSKMPQELADKRFNDWKLGKYRAIVNYGKLTTGVDHPAIDLICVLRPTTSTVLWVQMLGRGMRPYPGKENCLVLDFARNTERLGPVNDPVIPRKRKKGEEPGVAPIRICPQCGVYNHARATHCTACGCEFPKHEKLFAQAGTAVLIRRDEPQIITADVQRVIYNRHQKAGRPAMIKVSYFCGLRMFSEWICLEHGGIAAKKARDWWRERMGTVIPPPTTDEALKWVSQLRVPKQIRVHINKKYPDVLGATY